MRRRSAGRGGSGFTRSAMRTKSINLPAVIFRGGVRL